MSRIKSFTLRSGLTLFGLIVCSFAGAVPFRNLGFEEADISKTSPAIGTIGRYGKVEDILPGWTASLPDSPITDIGYNAIVGEQWLSLYNDSPTNSLPLPSGVASPSEGNFALYFGSLGASISQRGEIPSDAHYLLFDHFSNFGLFINGSEISYTTSGNRIGVADISAFSGQNVELKLTLELTGPFNSAGTLDNIRFTSSIPEPSTFALLAIGGFGLSICIRFSRR